MDYFITLNDKSIDAIGEAVEKPITVIEGLKEDIADLEEAIVGKDETIAEQAETIAELEEELSEAINPITQNLDMKIKSGFNQPFCKGCINSKTVSGKQYISGVNYDMRSGTQSDMTTGFNILRKVNRELTYVIFRSFQDFTVTPSSNLPQGVTISKYGSASVGYDVELKVPANVDMALAPVLICTITPQ